MAPRRQMRTVIPSVKASMGLQSVAGLSMHSLRTYSRRVTISCNVLQHSDSRHW
jgi:hypothetical protein